MRAIGTLEDDHQALLFGDHLTAMGIANSVDESSGHWTIWVHDDDKLDQARGELETFRQSPQDPRYQNQPKQAEAVRLEYERKQRASRTRYVDVRTSWSSMTARKAPLTLALIAISALVSLATHFNDLTIPVTHWFTFSDFAIDGGRIVNVTGLDAVMHGQFWRVFTPIFLHMGVLHFVFNMFWLRDLGAAVELRKGTLLLFLLVLVGALLSNFGEYFLGNYPSFRPEPFFGGMSGIVYALFGYVWMKGRLQPYEQLGVTNETVLIMLAWLVLCFTGLIGPIANVAHLVGLLVGVMFVVLPVGVRKIRRMWIGS
jgi:GlpG protein